MYVVPEKEKPRPACGECYYFVFWGLKRVCSHPRNPKLLKGGPLLCKSFVDIYPCVAYPGPPKWEIRLTHEEIGLRFGLSPQTAIVKRA